MNENLLLDDEKPKRSRRLTAAVVGTALAGVLAIATSGIASAQTVQLGADDGQPIAVVAQAGSAEGGLSSIVTLSQSDDETDHDDWPELSAEDQAVFERFEQCLTDAGATFEDIDEPGSIELDEATIDAAFEQCDPILEELSDVASGFVDVSPEDEAVWDQFDQCLADAGVPVDSVDGAVDGDMDEAAIDAAFEQCESVLDGLSDDSFAIDGEFMDPSPEDEALFEQFDQCLSDAGVPVDLDDGPVEGDVDEAAIDAAFEQCESILDGLSDDSFAIDGGFMDLSPEDEALFEQYDTCLEDAGIDSLFEAFDLDPNADDASAAEEAIDAVFDQCDPILEALSSDAQAFFEDCPDDE